MSETILAAVVANVYLLNPFKSNKTSMAVLFLFSSHLYYLTKHPHINDCKVACIVDLHQTHEVNG